MSSPYDMLFETVRIGPVLAPNRFYQVPHCNGFGHRMPRGMAAMRGMKAEGGWGVVCTEETEIHHSSDLSPYFEGRIWDDGDLPALQLMTEAVHKHGALAGIELSYNGIDAPNLYSRVPSLAPRSMGTVGGSGYDPVQTRRMDKEDIRNVRTWHREAALRAKRAGFDIVYCYAAHGMTTAIQFISKRYNDRTDEYGGSLENRVRFFRELIEETKEAIGDTCAVAVRFAVDELLGDDGITHQGEGYDVVAMLAELPDLWDVNISGWSNDSIPSRFGREGHQERYISFVKQLTTKPVVGVGRYTSPDSMVSVIKRGVMDLIGAARPSIADPFLPTKIKEGRIEDIRECIGCNICVTGDTRFVPIRCTQNPTMGEGMATRLASRDHFSEEERQGSDDHRRRTGGLGSRAGIGSTRLCGVFAGGAQGTWRTRPARIRLARSERMATRHRLALDPDQQDEECFGVSVQPDERGRYSRIRRGAYHPSHRRDLAA